MKSTILAGLALVALAGSVNAALITPGNVVVYRIGDTTNALSSAGTAVFVDEYTPAGALVQSIAMPTSGTNAFVASGTATSEGLLTVSPDGRYVTVTGYNANVGTASITGTASATVNRIVAVIDTTTGAATYTKISDAFNTNNIRSAVTDGTNLWVTGANSGVRYTTVGSAAGTTTQLSTTTTNLRQVNIFDGQLYITSSSGTTRTATVGTGLPTGTGNTIANLPGTPSSGSPYAFFFADLSSAVAGVDTLYVADDTSATGGLLKYSLVGGSWVSNGTVGVGSDAYRGLTASVDSSGVVTLFATRGGGSAAAGGGSLVTLTDSSGYNGAFAGTPTVLASALTGTSANTSFRGVGYIPVPTPGSIALLGLGGLVAARRRR
ncbi:MAG: hypothetical protein GC200_02300 [Tepidisphaera sp.]|nr:hypothetical protein [Tepidisphaera sp.]